MTSDPILDRIAALWEERDPVPPGLAGRMQRLARAEADLVATDWDVELMLLVERSDELAGARGTTSSYTLRFSHGDLELMLRVAPAGDDSRVDGWVVPALAMTVQATDPGGGDRGDPVEVGEGGRFELSALPAGLVRLRLVPHDPERTTIVTPTFEI